MSILQEQAIQMIGDLSDDNVGFLIELMQRFMFNKDTGSKSDQLKNHTDTKNFMQEMEAMRMKTKPYFSACFNPEQVWEEAMDHKYGSIG